MEISHVTLFIRQTFLPSSVNISTKNLFYELNVGYFNVQH